MDLVLSEVLRNWRDTLFKLEIFADYLECLVSKAVVDVRKAISVDSDSLMLYVEFSVPLNDADSYLAWVGSVATFAVN